MAAFVMEGLNLIVATLPGRRDTRAKVQGSEFAKLECHWWKLVMKASVGRYSVVLHEAFTAKKT
jgi:hypothetical protein